MLLVKIGSPTGNYSTGETQREIDAYQQSLVDRMSELVEGDMVPLAELPRTSDWKAIKKVRLRDPEMQLGTKLTVWFALQLYKLNEITLPDTGEADDKRVLEANMLNTLATKVVA